jgi:hypothetical protein
MIKSLKHMLQSRGLSPRLRLAPARRLPPSRPVSGTITRAAARSRSSNAAATTFADASFGSSTPTTSKAAGCRSFGDVKPVASGVWDGGWIIDPEKDLNTKYSVELTLLTPSR